MVPEELTCGRLSEGKSQMSPNATVFIILHDYKFLEDRDSSTLFHRSSLAANFLCESLETRIEWNKSELAFIQSLNAM